MAQHKTQLPDEIAITTSTAIGPDTAGRLNGLRAALAAAAAALQLLREMQATAAHGLRLLRAPPGPEAAAAIARLFNPEPLAQAGLLDWSALGRGLAELQLLPETPMPLLAMSRHAAALFTQARNALANRLAALERRPPVSLSAVRLLRQIGTPTPTPPAQAFLAGRLIERGWLLARRETLYLIPQPAPPGKRKTLVFQIDRSLWAQIRWQEVISRIPVREYAAIYLEVGLSWPEVDLPLDLSREGYAREIAAIGGAGSAMPLPSASFAAAPVEAAKAPARQVAVPKASARKARPARGAVKAGNAGPSRKAKV